MAIQDMSMYQIQELAKGYLFLIFAHFLLHIHLGPNQSLRHLLCFNFRCEDIIRIYPWRKTKSDQWLGKYYCTLGRIWAKQGVSKQVWFVPKTAGGLGWW